MLSYLSIFVAIFALGISYLLSKTYSQSFYIFSFVTLALYLIGVGAALGGTSFLAFAVGGLIVGTILKVIGL
jgi:hypothetical protein